MGAEAMTGLPFAAFIDAEIRLLTPEEGGRRSAISSGYRCNCWVGHMSGESPAYNDATVHLVGVDSIEPGETGRARVQPHFPDEWSHLDIGSQFELCEGPRVIGVARVLDLFAGEEPD